MQEEHTVLYHRRTVLYSMNDNKQIVETVLEFMKKYKVTAYDEKKNKGIVRHILTRVGKTTGEVMVCIIINAKKTSLSGRICGNDKKLWN